MDKFLRALSDLLFPNRAQVEYLKAQVAYHQRRADVLEARLISIATPAPVKNVRNPPIVPPAETGWDAYKRKARETNDQSEEAPQGNAPAVAKAS